MADQKDKAREVVITAKDLPVYCPRPDSPLWARHPRVFLPVEGQGGVAVCPYCSTRYVLNGELPKGHH